MTEPLQPTGVPGATETLDAIIGGVDEVLAAADWTSTTDLPGWVSPRGDSRVQVAERPGEASGALLHLWRWDTLTCRISQRPETIAVDSAREVLDVLAALRLLPARASSAYAMGYATAQTDMEQDQLAPTPGPAGDAVWMAALHRGLDMHQLDVHPPAETTTTVCGRPIRPGFLLLADRAVERYAAGRCPRCWQADAPADPGDGDAR